MKQETKFKDTEIGMIPEEWAVKKIKEIDKSKDSVKTGPFGSLLHAYDYVKEGEEGVPLLLVKNFDKGRLIDPDMPNVSVKKVKELPAFFLEKGDIVYSRVGEVGRTFFVTENQEGWMFSGQTLRIRIRNDAINPKFVDFFFQSPRAKYISDNTALGTTRPSINTTILKNRYVPVPPIDEQAAIVKILSDLDSKIELLQKHNKTLEAIGQAIFKHWFVDFEFPNEEGKPYKSSGGELVDSELGKEIPKGWEVGKLGDIIENFDSKRIPLSSRERKKRKGKFPYYGATKIMDYVDDYLFDGTYILMAEDGSVTDEGGYPVLRYVWGKFWANNHAHIIKGKGISTEFLYVLLLRTNISEYVTGAVQPKLNQTNMNSIKILIPDSLSVKNFDNLIQDMFIKQKSLYEQIQSLQKTRDTLLPKLMSGKIRVLNNQKIKEAV